MPPRAIVLCLDQLSRRCLGCYGHEWIETPHLDRLASRGVVFDQCFASPVEEPRLRDVELSSVERLSRGGAAVRWLCEADEAVNGGAGELNETSFAQLVTRAENTLTEWSRDPAVPWLLWLESSGIGWPDLATPQFVELYADELDDDVPDELVAIREIEVAYAALLTQFDHLLGRLLSTIERLFGDAPPLIVLMAAHGQAVCEAEMVFPFADHSAELPADASSFRDEFVHPPLLIAGATRDSLGSRRQELVTPADVLPTLSDWFGNSLDTAAENSPAQLASEGMMIADNVSSSLAYRARLETSSSLLPLLRNEDCAWRSELFLQDAEGHAAVRTEQFLFVQPNATTRLAPTPSGDEIDSDDSSGSLFLKPEDVWEVNNVANQHPEQVAMLRTALRTWLHSQGSEESAEQQPPLV